MNSRQLGNIKISKELIDKTPDKIAEILAALNFVAVRAELHYSSDFINYTGISSRFREIPMGEVIPDYAVTCELSDKMLIALSLDVKIEEIGKI